MAVCFSTEMKIESKNYNIPIFIYSKIEKKKFNTTYYSFFSFKLGENKMWNFFLIIFIRKFVNWVMINDHSSLIGYQAFMICSKKTDESLDECIRV